MENRVPQSIAPQLIHGASISRTTVAIFLSEEFDAIIRSNEHFKAVNGEKSHFRGEYGGTHILPLTLPFENGEIKAYNFA
jgi:hypothetical protein